MRHDRGSCVSSSTDAASAVQLESVAAFLAGHHAGDTGPGGSAKGPCAIAGMFGCAPAAASEEYGSVSTDSPALTSPWLLITLRLVRS